MGIFNILPLFSGIIPLLVIIGIIAAVVVLVRRRGKTESDPGIGTLKRLYYYGISFIALGVAAPGLILLIDFLLDNLFGPPAFLRGQGQLALGLALTIVGTPIWFLHWRLALKAVQQLPTEAQALSRQIYIYLVLGITASLFAFGLVSLLRWLLGSGDFNGFNIAFPLVWAGIWGYHWHLQSLDVPRTEDGATVRRLYVYITSLYSLVMLLVGVGIVIWRPLKEAYEALFTTQLLVSGGVNFWDSLWSDTTRTGVAILVVGGLLWWWHWHQAAKGDAKSQLRQVYLYLFAILGGAATVVISLSMILFDVLQWLIGEPGSDRASAHFRSFPGMIATLLPGAALWGYHLALVQQESLLSAERWQAARRVYRYLVAALGLITLSVGLVMVFLVAMGVLIPQAGAQLLDAQWWRNPLVLGITLLVVGIPIWSYYWFGVQRAVAIGPAQERTAQSRRIFIYGVFGIATLLVLGNLSALLYMFLRDLLEGGLSLQLLQYAKWSIGTLLMAGAVSVYHWLILQEDRRAMPAPAETPAPAVPVTKDLIAVAGESAQGLVRSLESLLGVPILVWRRLDGGDAPNLTVEELHAVREEIINAPGSRALLIVDASGIRVLPYRES
ncbi:MAG: DUF5671 domain-containing protein [Chloroflexi bacterium]|nr:DUF5671 domain-containing protein [Chloroflexota bacterium]